jgi:MFS family permease
MVPRLSSTPSQPAVTGIAGITIAALMIASAQNPLTSTLIAVALPSIGHDLLVDLVLATSLLVTSYFVISIVAQGPGGRFSDLFGHARTLWVGLALYAGGALVGFFAPHVSFLVASRCVMAVAGALVIPATVALLRLHVPPERRGRVFGLFSANMSFSAAMGPALGGELVSHFGWRAIYLANLPFLTLVALLLWFYPLPASPGGSRASGILAGFRALDFAGLALMTVSLLLLVVASREAGTMRAALLVAALVVAASFLRRQFRVAQPVLDVRLFRIPAFAAGTGIIGLQNFAMYALLFELPQFFERFRGTAPREVGYTLFTMMVGMVIMAPVGGRLMDRFGARRIGLLGSGVLLMGSLLLCGITSFASPADAVVPLLLFGMGMGLCSAPAQSSSMSVVPPQQAGMAAGISSTLRYLGGILGVVLLGMVLGSNETVTEGRHALMMVLFTVSVALSMFMCLRLPAAPAGQDKGQGRAA